MVQVHLNGIRVVCKRTVHEGWWDVGSGTTPRGLWHLTFACCCGRSCIQYSPDPGSVLAKNGPLLPARSGSV